jgi:hypothetical protein
MTYENITAGFRSAGLVSFNIEAVLSKLDVKFRTPTPPGSPTDADPWISQTPHTATEAIS